MFLLHHASLFVQLYHCHWQCDATATMLDSWHRNHRFQSPAFTLPHIALGQIAQSLSHLTIKPFTRSHLACPCEQMQILVELEGVDFWAGASFLLYAFLVQTVSLWTATSAFSSFHSCQAWVLVVPEHFNQLPLIWGWQFGYSSKLGKVVTHPKNLYLHAVVWTDHLELWSFLEMAAR